MPLLRHHSSPGGNTHHTSPSPSANPEIFEARKKVYMVSEAQRNDTFQESLRDFQCKFEAEEKTRLVEERTRQDEFNHTMTDFGDIFFKNHLRRQELYKETDVLQEERFRKADAAREAIFVQGQNVRTQDFDIDQEKHGKRAEWHNRVRQATLADGRQRLQDKCAALNAALVDQFNRLRTEGRKEFVRVAEDPATEPPIQTKYRPPLAHARLPSRRPVSPTQSITSSPPPPTWIMIRSSSPSPNRVSAIPSHSPSIQHPLNSSIQPTSTESNDQQGQLLSLTERGNPEGSANQSDWVVDDNFYTSFTHSQKQRQETFLKDESERKYRFHTLEAVRDTEESERSVVFDRQMDQWSKTSQKSKDSQTQQFCGREEERYRWNTRRSIAFWTAQEHCWHAFDAFLSHMVEQAEAETEVEETWFKDQRSMILALYEDQADQLAAASHRQTISSYVATMLSTWLPDAIRGLMGRRDQEPEGPERVSNPAVSVDQADFFMSRPGLALASEEGGPWIGSSYPTLAKPRLEGRFRRNSGLRRIFKEPDVSFAPSAMFRGGAFIQGTLPVPQITDRVDCNMHQRQGTVVDPRRMQSVFEESQELRADAFEKGANERRYIFTINEAKRGAEFVKAQQKRKEVFGEAEELRESTFQVAQQHRESEFQANERKREAEFRRDEAERNAQTRRAQKDRESQFRSTMAALQRNCVEDENRRLEELKDWGQELMMSREQGQERLHTD